MRHIQFKEANRRLNPIGERDNREPLTVFEDEGMVISCWKMSLRERFSALFFGRAWVCVKRTRVGEEMHVNARRTVFHRNK